tara:strand:- start:1001 stop:1300 length:300 start_codon:yes stop_codon:yes gene_type:complete
MFYVKLHRTKYGTLLAACDKNIIGKTLKEENLEFFVSPHFYKGREVDKKELIRLLNLSEDGNLVGKETIKTATEVGVITQKTIAFIQKTPHAQFSKIGL